MRLPLALLVSFVAGPLFAQLPAITSVENAASNIPPGLPNAGIALGAMFVVKGSNLGPSSIVVANSFPLQESLANTSVAVNIGGRTFAGIMYYTLNRQVAAILPSSAIAGIGTITVSYNGLTSASFPISIVTSNVAMYTLNSTGLGDAIVTLGNNTFVAPNNAPNPGDTVVLWANGLGPVTFDETRAAPGGDLTTVLLEAFVGGQPAEVLYRGRNACCASVDQINIRLPLNVTGCAVPITLKIGTLVSNTTTLPIAFSGRTCTPARPGLTQGDVERLLRQSNIRIGSIDLFKRAVTTSIAVPGAPPITTTARTDGATANFLRFTSPASSTITSFGDVITFGSCSVTSFSGQTPPDTGFGLSFQALDAGPSLTLNAPVGVRTLTRTNPGGAVSYNVTLDNTGTFLGPGPYAMVGSGGPDVSSLTANITAPTPIVWTNLSSLFTVARDQGMRVDWSGGDPNGYVQISGISLVGTAPNPAGAFFTCTARASDRTLRVPPAVLLALPPSGLTGGVIVPGTLTLRGVALQPFTASGLDFGFLTFSSSTQQSATYQ